jgi:uncharacterized protein YfaT (DUF1175 family)
VAAARKISPRRSSPEKRVNDVVKYNLAYINYRISGADNGRVLGYDNSHEYHHRHFMGRIERIEFTGYEELTTRFRREVEELWRREDEQA